MPANRKAALGFIFFTLLIDVTGLGIIIPVLPKLIEELIHGNISLASRYGGWLTFAYAIMQFFFSPFLGNLSDKYGRRPVLLFSLFGFGIDYIFLSFAPTIGWLFVGRIIAGITGASFTTATAYIADISAPEDRAKNFGLIGAAFGLGFIIGPVIGGLLGQYGSRIPFLAAAGLTFLNFFYGFFVLPESLPVENRRNFEWKRANPFGAFKHLEKYPAVAALAISFFLVYMAGQSVQSVWSFFGIERFNWSPKLIGISLGTVGLLVGLVQGVLIRYINPKLGNIKSIYIGFGLYAFGLVLFACATQGWMMFIFLIPYCLGGISGPALQSIITGHVPANEQGELQGALTSLISATSILSPVIMTSLFAHFTSKSTSIYFPGAPFVLGAILMAGAGIVAYKVLNKEKEGEDYTIKTLT
ncbi:TCR/Tet family MFS transporter [Ginsengibacter hankyongi]|uniref:TCR/Tet family MFS transporter n=1 Tax=Ginsengibacter hankyongi TaxID=2607284 RepID=A0A5J5IEU9_9BACT|nr:TCR/Tet family MFS transporter [Ginsengibacter hankyongi]KAA9034506.1 TCR/Tet family MFS transporter [Ginsengibacter hankyongi]